jgi:hypothetical protein
MVNLGEEKRISKGNGSVTDRVGLVQGKPRRN